MSIVYKKLVNEVLEMSGSDRTFSKVFDAMIEVVKKYNLRDDQIVVLQNSLFRA